MAVNVHTRLKCLPLLTEAPATGAQDGSIVTGGSGLPGLFNESYDHKLPSMHCNANKGSNLVQSKVLPDQST